MIDLMDYKSTSMQSLYLITVFRYDYKYILKEMRITNSLLYAHANEFRNSNIIINSLYFFATSFFHKIW